MNKRDKKYEADRITRRKIHKAARLRERPGTEGERLACFAAIARLVKRLNFSYKSYERYWMGKVRD